MRNRVCFVVFPDVSTIRLGSFLIEQNRWLEKLGIVTSSSLQQRQPGFRGESGIRGGGRELRLHLIPTTRCLSLASL